jgi:hypothetical protein
MKKLILLLTILISEGISAQGYLVVSSRDSARKFTLSGFADLYIGYQLGGKKQKEDFYYNHKVNNRLRTNLLLIKGEYESPRFHAVLGLMTGDYSKYNLAAEPNWAKPLNEAYLGVRLSKHQNIWWDAGVYSSYLGIESSVSSDSPTLTRSVVSENTPYYFCGSRISLKSKNRRNEIYIHLLNGWQRIGWDPNIKRPSFGAHYKYWCRENLSLMYGVFYGSVYPDSLGIQRLYHHVNANWKKGKWEMWGTLDLGTESGSLWGAAQVMGQCTFNNRWSLTQRLEVYYDPDNRCARVGANKETIIGGYALSGNFNLGKNILIRLEPKILLASEEIFKGESFVFQCNAGFAARF